MEPLLQHEKEEEEEEEEEDGVGTTKALTVMFHRDAVFVCLGSVDNTRDFGERRAIQLGSDIGKARRCNTHTSPPIMAPLFPAGVTRHVIALSKCLRTRAAARTETALLALLVLVSALYAGSGVFAMSFLRLDSDDAGNACVRIPLAPMFAISAMTGVCIFLTTAIGLWLALGPAGYFSVASDGNGGGGGGEAWRADWRALARLTAAYTAMFCKQNWSLLALRAVLMSAGLVVDGIAASLLVLPSLLFDPVAISALEVWIMLRPTVRPRDRALQTMRVVYAGILFAFGVSFLYRKLLGLPCEVVVDTHPSLFHFACERAHTAASLLYLAKWFKLLLRKIVRSPRCPPIDAGAGTARVFAL
jgi:hypothetical protein